MGVLLKRIEFGSSGRKFFPLRVYVPNILNVSYARKATSCPKKLFPFRLMAENFNRSLAEHDMPCLSKQCRRRKLILICTVCL